MPTKIAFKKIVPWIFGVLGLFLLLSFAGVYGRKFLLLENEPFASWSYDGPYSIINVWTSWDSGFYYDIASNSYPIQKDFVSVSTINVPAKSWVKVFTGYLQIGDSRYSLPSETSRISNVVFLLGDSVEPKEVKLFSAYPGIPYCVYRGPIDFERDVLVHRNSLENPEACVDGPCERVYFTYYDAATSQVGYQEYFDQDFFEVPRVTVGATRPYGFDNVYEGFGCKTIEPTDIRLLQDVTFEQTFTPYPFGFLYPFLSRVGDAIFGDMILGGLALSFLCTLGSIAFLYFLSKEYFEEKIAVSTVLVFLSFPLAFFNFTFQPISLLCMLYFASLYFAKKEKMLLLGTFLLLIGLSGPYYFGLLVLPPLFFISRKKLTPLLVGIFSIFIGIIIRVVYIYKHTVDLFALFKAHAPWFGGTSNPLLGLVNYFGSMDIYKFFELGVFVMLLVLCGWLIFNRNGTSEDQRDLSLPDDGFDVSLGLSFLVSYALFPLLNGGFVGILKYYFLLLPIFLFLGESLSKKKRFWMLVVLLLLNTFLFVLWTTSSRFVV